MVVPDQVQRSMDCEQAELMREGHPASTGLGSGARQGDHDVSQVTHARRGTFIRGRKGQHVGHGVPTGEAGVEPANPSAVGQHDGQLAGARSGPVEDRLGSRSQTETGGASGDLTPEVDPVLHFADGPTAFDA